MPLTQPSLKEVLTTPLGSLSQGAFHCVLPAEGDPPLPLRTAQIELPGYDYASLTVQNLARGVLMAGGLPHKLPKGEPS